MNEERKTICIFSGKLARALLHKGFNIIDIKANKDEPKASVFVFEYSDAFFDAWKECR